MLRIRLSVAALVVALLAMTPTAARGQCTWIVNPVSQAFCAGDTAVFTASAVAFGGTYTWLKNGTTVVGTGTTLTITNVGAGDVGSYTCRVVGSPPFSCTSTSSAAALTIRTLAGISSQPGSEAACLGQSFTPSVTASGTGPFTYQWRRGVVPLVDGGRISGAETPNLTISGVVAGDAAVNYNCVITGPCNAVTSGNVLLFVLSPHTISSQPASLSRCVGESASFTVGVTGSTSGFQWRRGTTPLVNGGNISGANLDTLVINPVTPGDDASNYNCVITGSCAATITTNNVDLNVQTPAQFVAYGSSTGSGLVCQGSTLNLTVTTTGTVTGRQWRRGTTPLVNGGRFSGVNTATLVITNFQPSDAGNYNCVLSSPCGGLIAPDVELINRVPVNITASPANVTTCPGGPVGLSVLVTGSSPNYQWRRGATDLVNGPGISGADGPTLTLSGPALVAGEYTCLVSNACNSQTSTPATVTVRSIAMTTPPVATTVVVPNGFVLTGTATATPAGSITYTWTRNNVPITSGGRFSISPDGRTLTVLTSFADDFNASFGLTATDGCGNTVTNIVPVFAVTTTEVEPNDTKATANLRSLGEGGSISGSTVGGTDSSDYFRLILPQGSGISRWQLSLVSGNQGLRLRGLNQASGVPQPASNATFQSGSPTQPLVWYTSGSATPQLYVSVEAPAPGTTSYVLQLTRTDVTPGLFPVVIAPGPITFTTQGIAGILDTELWLYDSDFNAIEGAGNDGAPSSNSIVLLTRTLAAGDYYVAHGGFNVSSSLPNPPDDNWRGDTLLEFPGVIACSNNAVTPNLTFRAGPAAGTITSFTPTFPPGAFTLAWTKVVVGTAGCNPADIAQSDGTPGPDGTVNNGDFQCFFTFFFTANCPSCDGGNTTPCNAADIAQADGTPGPDSCVNNGDFQCFFANFFLPCP